MAKKRKVNKSQMVRDYMKAHPAATSSEIAEALTKQGTKISSGHVANIKSKSKQRRRAVKTVRAKRGVSVPEIKAALALIKASGSASAAKEAVSAAEEIRAMV